MPQFQTQELLRQLEEDVRTISQITEQEFSHLSLRRLQTAPGPGQWSVAECLEHLNTYGRYYLPLIEQAIRRGEDRRLTSSPVFHSGWLGDYFTGMMRPQANGTIRKKYQAAEKHRPAPELDAEAVVTEFRRQQQQLAKLLQQAQQVDLKRLKIPISIARWISLSLGDVFRFVIAHEQRHIQQAKRALKAHSLPA